MVKKTFFLLCIFAIYCDVAKSASFAISLDTTPLVGHPAAPFSTVFTFTDGDGIGDSNNNVTINDITFGGGSALGSPLVFGGASGSLGSGVAITDDNFLNFFTQQFAPGLQLAFALGLTSNADLGDTPDGFGLLILDSSGVPLPTLSPFGDYFLTVDLTSSGPVFNTYGSDPTRAPTIGNPISITAPTVTAVSTVPEPGAIYLLGLALGSMILLKIIGSLTVWRYQSLID
jgi:hypothetical protein